MSRPAAPPNPLRLGRAELILDAFSSWDAEPLSETLGASEGADAMGYYQNWAEAAHYVVQVRPTARSSRIRPFLNTRFAELS